VNYSLKLLITSIRQVVLIMKDLYWLYRSLESSLRKLV